jgi:hypothetical protein
MILTGLLALLVGAILAFAVPGHVGDVSVGTVGVIVMIVGAVILIAGLPRLRRGRRLDRRRSGQESGQSGRAVAERVVDGRVVAGSAGGNAGATGPLAAQRERVYRTSKGKIAAMIIAAVYIVSPVDFIPDFLLPVGVIDDATAFGWLIFAVGQEFSRRRGPAV